MWLYSFAIFMGDALLAKTHTFDFLTKKRVKNNGIVPQYYVENSHEPIIPKTLFLQVQEEMARRSNLRNKKGAITYSSKCGEIYRRLHWNNRGKKSIVWRCYSCLDKTKHCDARTVNEDVLKQAVMDGINQVFADEERIKNILAASIHKLLSIDDSSEVASIDSKLLELQTELLELSSENQNVMEIGEQILQLKEKKQNLLLNKVTNDNSKQRMQEMLEFIDKSELNDTGFDDVLVRRLVEKVLIFDEHIAIKFKSGIEIEMQS